MSRKRETGGPGTRRNHVGTLVTDDELAVINRVAARYGLSKSAAARMLILTGAAQHDPSPPKNDQ